MGSLIGMQIYSQMALLQQQKTAILLLEIGEALSGSCEYCGCRMEFKRVASFNAVDKVDLGRLRKLFEAAKSSPQTPESHSEGKSDLALALCYLLAGNFVLAKKRLAAVVENAPSSAEPYYYYALTLVNGRNLSELTMREAKLITQYLQTAMSIDEDFIFPKLFFALLCMEYYEANDLRAPEDGEALLNGLAGSDIDSQEFAFFKSAISTEVI